jgi:hypothetical protein
MTAWAMAVNMKAQVHLLLGMYILGARRTVGGRVVGKPSRSWYPPGWGTCGWYAVLLKFLSRGCPPRRDARASW